jgi:RNA 2',3'-cyclic 3'-phosphodiesterase
VSARLFAALDLPVDVRAQLAAFGQACATADPALRAVGEDVLHVTLAFLGHRPLTDVDAAADAVRAAVPGSAQPVPLELGEPLWLSPRRPQVLTIALADVDGALARLQREVADRLAGALDWSPERRAFRPHVTVARVRSRATPRRRGLAQAPRATFAARALTLYRSHLGRGPARYEALARVPLDMSDRAG